MRNPHRALEAIEYLVGSDFGLDMEWLLHDKREKNIDPRLKQAARMITDIYIIAHAENNRGCRHEEWENKKYQIIKEAVY